MADVLSYEPPAFTEHFNKLPPDVLYHYTGQVGLIGIVENAELWATKIQYMNDATEFDLALVMAREQLQSITSGSLAPGQAAACSTLQASLSGLEDINIFAACFCEDGDLLSQWRGYVGRGHGYSIGFDSESLMHVGSVTDFTLGKCIYDAEVQREIVEQAIAYCLQNELEFPSRNRWGFHGPLADILFRCGAFFKDGAFSEEREWRLISRPILFNNDKLRFRPGNSMIVPYYALPIRSNGALPIQDVIVGPCPHMELAKSAVTSLLMGHGLLGPLRGRAIAFASKIPFRNW